MEDLEDSHPKPSFRHARGKSDESNANFRIELITTESVRRQHFTFANLYSDVMLPKYSFNVFFK